MPRARTGSLAYKRTTGWNARVWVPVTSGDGTAPEVRRWVPLETHDEDLAKRKMTKIVALIATGEYSVDEMKHTALRGQTCREEMVAFIASRRAAGVGMADDEEQRLTDYAMHRIGDMLVTHVRMRDINAILFAAKSSLSHETLRKLRGALDRMFEGLCKAEVIKENPVDRSEIPEGARVDERPRTILTDAEIITFLEGRASGPNGKRPRRDAERRLHELKVMAVCSRVLGGLRTAEVNRWSWDMVVDPDAKLQTYARVNVRRAKAKRGHQGKVQTFSVPAPMRPILAAWHELHGRPLDGPVFPVTKGRRKGEERSKRGTSYANRLRRELLRMGITRQAIHKDTPTSRRVDFHSFRRAFSTALAEAGVNEQRAMILTAHADSKTHALYVQKTAAMQAIPDGAVQMLPAGPLTAPIGTGVPLLLKAIRRTPEKLARPVRFELTTSGFEVRASLWPNPRKKRAGAREPGATVTHVQQPRAAGGEIRITQAGRQRRRP